MRACDVYEARQTRMRCKHNGHITIAPTCDTQTMLTYVGEDSYARSRCVLEKLLGAPIELRDLAGRAGWWWWWWYVFVWWGV